MVNPAFKLTGIAYCEHKGFGGMLVVKYAEGFTPSSDSSEPIGEPNLPETLPVTPVEQPKEPESPEQS